VLRTFGVLFTAAAVVATFDLANKAASISEPMVVHDRSTVYVVGGAAASLVWALLILLTRSPSIALAGGFMLGGAAGNLLSAALWPGVPDPLVAGDLAFNLADLSIALGIALLLPATIVFAMRNRARLFEPI
jgi:lipoprotein signal peptidase